MNTLLFAVAWTATNAVTTLSPIIVEASRLDKKPVEIAGHVETISRERIAASGEKSLPALAAHLPGLTVSNMGAGNPALAQISMRGYGENGFGRVLLVVDGEKINNPDMSTPNAARLALSGVEQIEVLYGPQTVLQGDGASAGLINIVTAPQDGTPRTYAELHAGSFGSAGAALGTRGRLEEESLSYRADAAYDHSDGYRDHSRFDIYNAQGGLRQDFANGSHLRFSTFFTDARYDLPGPLSRSNFHHDPTRSTYDDEGRQTTYGVNLSAKGCFDDENALSGVLTFSQRQGHYTNGDYTDIYGNFNRYSRDYASDTYSIRLAPRFTSTSDLLGFGNKFITGLETRYDLLRGDSLDIYPDYALRYAQAYDIDRLTGGVFAQDEFKLLDELSLVLGSRLERDWNANNVAADGSRADNFVAYESALNYCPTDDAKVFLRWCRFYRNPFIDEYTYRNAVARETTKPERGWDVEFGALWSFADEWTAHAVTYCSEVKNEIHLRPDTYSNENSPYLHRRKGIDLSLDWKREKVAGFRIAWSGVDAEKAEGPLKGNWVAGVPRQQLAAEGRVWVWDEFDVFGGYRLLGARYAISDTRNLGERLEPASVFRLGFRYKPTYSILRGATLTFVCDNLFDENYCDYAVASANGSTLAYYPAAGRSFTLSLRYEF